MCLHIPFPFSLPVITSQARTASVLSAHTTTTTKPFVPSIWGRPHEPKENYAG